MKFLFCLITTLYIVERNFYILRHDFVGTTRNSKPNVGELMFELIVIFDYYVDISVFSYEAKHIHAQLLSYLTYNDYWYNENQESTDFVCRIP